MLMTSMAGLPGPAECIPREDLPGHDGMFLVTEAVSVKHQQNIISPAPRRREFSDMYLPPHQDLDTERAKPCSVCFVHTACTWRVFVSFSPMNICQWSIETAQCNPGAGAGGQKAQDSPTQRRVQCEAQTQGQGPCLSGL